ncbi:hypothetical protein JYB62_03225 [Algoriphagus lutimaris]|uniref:DUF6503 family protein n=1 Tax=Algoriphagus lutimaris TaxID=613197 RepID=UPI00196AE5A6|nr:DUF6503 family protein [Algoriphagus lutimaris]MBN3519002.1 hypothetical protein [Algoriphagus lutimaris]
MNIVVKSLFFFSLATVTFSCDHKVPTTGEELVQRAIKYHDPKGNWDNLKATFIMKDSLPPGRNSRSYEFYLDNSNSKMTYTIEGLEYQVMSDSLVILMGEISKDRALRMRNYYTYLWGLPMKLNDPGTFIEKEIRKEIVDGKEYLVARVPYEDDQWYFYFEPETYRMVAYKFYKDEPNQVGEIIYLEGEKEFNGIKIPANRTWYRTEKPEFLGVDMLQEIK